MLQLSKLIIVYVQIYPVILFAYKHNKPYNSVYQRTVLYSDFVAIVYELHYYRCQIIYLSIVWLVSDYPMSKLPIA